MSSAPAALLFAVAVLELARARAQEPAAKPEAPPAKPGEQEPAHQLPARELRPGHWIEARGALDESGRFVIEKAELVEPPKYVAVIGTVPAGEVAPERFALLGLTITTTADTRWGQIEPSALAGARIKVEGRFRGSGELEAREISARGAGRDRVLGRIDAIDERDARLEFRALSLVLVCDPALEIECAVPPAEIALSEVPPPDQPEDPRDEDDRIDARIELLPHLRLGGQLEYEMGSEEDFDLDDPDQEDRLDNELSARLRFDWTPPGTLLGSPYAARAEIRQRFLFRDDEQDGWESEEATTLGETYLRLYELGLTGLSLDLGRQDFDDPREWIYDENLDAARVTFARARFAAELSVSSSFSIDESTSDRNEDTLNWIAYVSNNDYRRHLALWIVDRYDQSDDDDSPIWFGARALGRWIPDNKSWAEFSLRRGFREFTDLEGYAFDVGTTYSPAFLSPFYVSTGFAYATGDDDPLDATDDAFRQTGFHDNTAKLGGVTSFQYYGELLDPELSNLQIATLGIGFRPIEKTSVDLVYHAYQQTETTTGGLFAEIDPNPDGSSSDIGWELDLVLGWRRHESWDVEIVGATFDPGDAFAQSDPAYLLRFQFRYRF